MIIDTFSSSSSLLLKPVKAKTTTARPPAAETRLGKDFSTMVVLEGSLLLGFDDCSYLVGVIVNVMTVIHHQRHSSPEKKKNPLLKSSKLTNVLQHLQIVCSEIFQSALFHRIKYLLNLIVVQLPPFRSHLFKSPTQSGNERSIVKFL